jgi:hypothetical protein
MICCRSQHGGGAWEFLLKAGKRASFVAKRPNYGNCASYASKAMRSDNGQPVDNDKQCHQSFFRGPAAPCPLPVVVRVMCVMASHQLSWGWLSHILTAFVFAFSRLLLSAAASECIRSRQKDSFIDRCSSTVFE